MIVTFPLLMDATINSSVVPGVCKNLERYCLIHKLDTILKWGGLPSDSRIIQWGVAAAQVAGSALLASEIKKGNVLSEDDIHVHNTGNEKVTVITGDKDDKKHYDPEGEKVDIKAVDVKSTLSIEPTWVTVQSKKGSAVVGVKVIPYPIPAVIPIGFVVELVTPVPTVRYAPASTVTLPSTVSCNFCEVLSLIWKVPAFTCKLPFNVRADIF